MSRPRIYQYAILWHPTIKEIKEEGKKSFIAIDVTNILACDDKQAQMMAAMSIPDIYRNQLDQIEIALRPF